MYKCKAHFYSNNFYSLPALFGSRAHTQGHLSDPAPILKIVPSPLTRPQEVTGSPVGEVRLDVLLDISYLSFDTHDNGALEHIPRIFISFFRRLDDSSRFQLTQL